MGHYAGAKVQNIFVFSTFFYYFCRCRPDNPASARVLTQAGFREFGYARDYLRLGQTWYDHRLFERTNPSWTLEDAA